MHYAAQVLWFVAIMVIPIAEVVAIEFTGPVWVALLAVLVLGERMTTARIVAVALGVIGVVIIVRPGLDHVEVGQVVALLAAIGFAGSIILVKSLTRTESVVSIIFWMLIMQAVIGAIPLTALAAWLVFSERFDIFTILGAGVILGGNLLNLKRSPSPPLVVRQRDTSLREIPD